MVAVLVLFILLSRRITWGRAGGGRFFLRVAGPERRAGGRRVDWKSSGVQLAIASPRTPSHYYLPAQEWPSQWLPSCHARCFCQPVSPHHRVTSPWAAPLGGHPTDKPRPNQPAPNPWPMTAHTLPQYPVAPAGEARSSFCRPGRGGRHAEIRWVWAGSVD